MNIVYNVPARVNLGRIRGRRGPKEDTCDSSTS
jgi:hypothetical protein